MSRDLPWRPDFDHLRKQAKALLRAMRLQRAETTLADAQHAVAREYGFASWPKLKAHIEALPRAVEPARPMFERFTPAARQALFFSRYEAAQLGNLRIAPEHVLLGVIRSASGLTQTLLTMAGVTADEARTATIATDRPREQIVEPVQIPFQPPTKAVFAAAADEADTLGHAQIATVHLLLGVLRESDSAGTFLTTKGLSIDAVRQAAAAATSDERT
jgi:hypothetical protein